MNAAGETNNGRNFKNQNRSDSLPEEGGFQRNRSSASGASQQGSHQGRPGEGAMEVSVDDNIDRAMRVLKRKLIKEGLFKELKSRRYYEKPSDRKKRKEKESFKKLRKEEARKNRNPFFS